MNSWSKNPPYASKKCEKKNKLDFLYQAVGVGSASRIYFGKEVQDLDLQESAILVLLPYASIEVFCDRFGQNFWVHDCASLVFFDVSCDDYGSDAFSIFLCIHLHRDHVLGLPWALRGAAEGDNPGPHRAPLPRARLPCPHAPPPRHSSRVCRLPSQWHWGTHPCIR